jgi:hypothetical protein
LNGTPLQGVTVHLYDAYVIWQIALAIFNGNIPSLIELETHISPVRQATTAIDGRYQWTDIPSGNVYVVCASKPGYLEKYTEPFPIQAADRIITKDLSLPDAVNTLAGVVREVEDVNEACRKILENNARLAGEMTKQWFKDDLYSYNWNWFSTLGTVVGAVGGGIHSLPDGITATSQEAMKHIMKEVIRQLTMKNIPLNLVNNIRAWLLNNSFPKDELAYKASEAHVPYLQEITIITHNFVEEAQKHPVTSGFSARRAEDVANQIADQVNRVISGSNPYVASPDSSEALYGFTMSDIVGDYMELSERKRQLELTENILSGVQIVGGIITIGSAATGAGAPVAGVALIATKAAGWGKVIVASTNIATKWQMGQTFATGICATYPNENDRAVSIIGDYVDFLYEESSSPFYLHKDNRFEASTEVNLNLFLGSLWTLGLLPGFDTAQGNATVTVRDQSNVLAGGSNVTVRCLGYGVWSPATIGGLLGFSQESLLISSEVRGPTSIEVGGSVQYSVPFWGFSRNFVSLFKPHYLQVDTYVGPWLVDSDYQPYYVLAPLEFFRPITLATAARLATSDLPETLSYAVNAGGEITLESLKQYSSANRQLVDVTLSATEPNLSIQFAAEPNLYAIDLRLFAPQDSTVSIIVADETGKCLGYSVVDGVLYSELLGSVTNMGLHPICIRLLQPPEGEIYTVEIMLLSPGLKGVPVALFYEPVEYSGATMIASSSHIVVDGHRGTKQNMLLRLAEASGQEALTDVNATLSTIEQWGGGAALPVLSDTNQVIGDIPAGEQRYVAWDVNYPQGTELGKYVGTATVSSNETADLSIPVIALVRHSTETVSLYGGPDPNSATIQKVLTLGPDGKAETWVHIPRGYHVVHAAMGIVGASANLQNPSIDIGADGSVEWAFSGKFDLGVLVNNVEDAFNDYLAEHTPDANGVNVPIRVVANAGETILLNGIQLHLDSIPGDSEPDGDVDSADLDQLASNWLEADCDEPDWCDGCDLNRDEAVDFDDFADFGAVWLETSP